MHSVTPLFHADTSASALESYGRSLATFARRQLDPASVGEASLDARAQRSGNVTATLEAYPVATLSDAGRGRPPRANVPEPPALLAVLLSGAPAAADARHHSGWDARAASAFVHWPLLLVRASPALGEALRAWLQHTFDCRCSPLRLKPHELAQLAGASVAAWMEVSDGRTASKPLELTYAPSSPSDKLKQMVVTVAAHDMRRMARAGAGSGAENDHEDHVRLLDQVRNHVSTSLGINLDAFSLLRFGTGAAYLSAEGKIKLFGNGPIAATLDLLASLTTVAQRRCVR